MFKFGHFFLQQNDGKSKTKQEDFNNKLKQLLSSLAEHFDAHNSVDKVAADFMANRLPPIEQKEEAMKDDNGELIDLSPYTPTKG